jgi:hypothetical protein
MWAEAIAMSGRETHGWDCFWQAMAHLGLGNLDQARQLASKARELADSDRLGANVTGRPKGTSNGRLKVLHTVRGLAELPYLVLRSAKRGDGIRWPII